jgi:hypothetical protein
MCYQPKDGNEQFEINVSVCGATRAPTANNHQYGGAAAKSGRPKATKNPIARL